jgi:hypothetical protein
MAPFRALAACAVVCVCALGQGPGRVNPEVAAIVGGISQDRIAASMKTLGAFETRGNFTQTNDTKRGIGAARRWIYDQFRSYSPRLDVSLDSHRVKAAGRIFRDVDVVNVIAVLPGTSQSDHRVIVSAHYDSLSIVTKEGAGDFRANGEGATDAMDNEKSAVAPAPGVTDDASGVALVLELARVMSRRKFEKTIVFAAFGGEEIGLVGSTLYADRAKQNGDRIDAVFNNDIVGSDDAGNGLRASGLVHVFSEEPADSSSRELARYVRDCAQRYVPGFNASPVFRNDRFGRGGDHFPFVMDGYPGVRFTSAAENLKVQHTPRDTFEISSPAYTANVARVNAAALASLAFAPPTPDVTREGTSAANRGRRLPNLSRGKDLSDAVLKWSGSGAEDLAGYAVVVRSTTAPYWDHEIFVGNVTQYTLSGVNIDDVVLGVKAMDRDGNESPVSAYVALPFPRPSIEVVDENASTQP